MDNTLQKKTFEMDMRYVGILVVIAVAIAFFTIITPAFIGPRNLHDVVLDAVIPIIMGVGLAIVMSAGGFDLSIGAVASTSGVLTAIFMKNMDLPIPVSVILTLLICAAIGGANGLLVTKCGVIPFVATLGMQFLLLGFRLWSTMGRQITSMDRSFVNFTKGSVGGLSNQIIILIIVIIAFFFIMKHLKFGRYMSAVGSNINASRYSGINVSRYTWLSYMISSVMCGFCGIVLLSRNNVATVTMADGFMLQAITVAVFSEVIFVRFNSIGLFLAGVTVSIMTMGVASAHIDPNAINLVIGIVMLVVILLGKSINSDAAKARKAAKQLKKLEEASTS